MCSVEANTKWDFTLWWRLEMCRFKIQKVSQDAFRVVGTRYRSVPNCTAFNWFVYKYIKSRNAKAFVIRRRPIGAKSYLPLQRSMPNWSVPSGWQPAICRKHVVAIQRDTISLKCEWIHDYQIRSPAQIEWISWNSGSHEKFGINGNECGQRRSSTAISRMMRQTTYHQKTVRQ